MSRRIAGSVDIAGPLRVVDAATAHLEQVHSDLLHGYPRPVRCWLPGIAALRPRFAEALAAAVVAYQEAQVDVGDDGVTLYPSRPPVVRLTGQGTPARLTPRPLWPHQASLCRGLPQRASCQPRESAASHHPLGSRSCSAFLTARLLRAAACFCSVGGWVHPHWRGFGCKRPVFMLAPPLCAAPRPVASAGLRRRTLASSLPRHTGKASQIGRLGCSRSTVTCT